MTNQAEGASADHIQQLIFRRGGGGSGVEYLGRVIPKGKSDLSREGNLLILHQARLDRLAVYDETRAKRKTVRAPRGRGSEEWVLGKIERHLAGLERIGLRVVHEQGGRFVSWVAAFDLDDHDLSRNRLPDALRLVEVLAHYGFRLGEGLWVERSKTGGGVHLWLFFAEPFQVRDWRERAELLLVEARLPAETEVFPAGGRRGGTSPWTPYFNCEEAERTGQSALIEPSGRVIPLDEFLNRARPAPTGTFEKLPTSKTPPKPQRKRACKLSWKGCIKPMVFEPPPRIKRMMERGLWRAPAGLPRGPFPPGKRNRPRYLAALTLARTGKSEADFGRWNDENCGPCSDSELSAIWAWAWREQ